MCQHIQIITTARHSCSKAQIQTTRSTCPRSRHGAKKTKQQHVSPSNLLTPLGGNTFFPQNMCSTYIENTKCVSVPWRFQIEAVAAVHDNPLAKTLVSSHCRPWSPTTRLWRSPIPHPSMPELERCAGWAIDNICQRIQLHLPTCQRRRTKVFYKSLCLKREPQK